MPGADIAPQKGKGRASHRRFRLRCAIGILQLTLEEPVLRRVGIEGNAGQQANSRHQAQ